MAAKKKMDAPLDQRIIKIAELIRLLREQGGYSSSETFAHDFDLPRVQYWRMENGTNFQFTSLLKILDAHKMSLTEFFSRIKT